MVKLNYKQQLKITIFLTFDKQLKVFFKKYICAFFILLFLV